MGGFCAEGRSRLPLLKVDVGVGVALTGFFLAEVRAGWRRERKPPLEGRRRLSEKKEKIFRFRVFAFFVVPPIFSIPPPS
jgi:hypothetical protein